MLNFQPGEIVIRQDEVADNTKLVQHGVNKPPIQNSQKAYKISILSFYFCLLVLVALDRFHSSDRL
ncbi:MAG: hypothetical protein V7L22_08605 [Nostoc sp.]|uniref:hypothetical protein n=1 Tax=Nostoc sp. TaxID=1180 RepID=UPI002FFC814F